MTSFFCSKKSLAIIAGLLVAALGLRGQDASLEQEKYGPPPSELVKRESKYWTRTSIPEAPGVLLEVSGILALPGKRLMVTTRRGEVWSIDGAYELPPRPRFTRFASGLHEPLGIVPASKGGYYIAQREEITRVADTSNRGQADLYETIYKVPIGGSYHEFAYGPVLGPNGNMRVTLNVAFGGAPVQGPVPWRGWMIEITPDGQMTPIAAGLRSPCGFTYTSQGLWLYAENQGEWVGSGWVTEVEPGDFMAHPAALTWTRMPGSTVKLRPDDIRDFREPYVEVAKRVPGLKLPTVWFPYTIFGVSTSGIAEDTTGGKFGPFAGQFFVADQGQSRVMRMTLEKVKGVWQGASYAFRQGFDCGIIRLTWGEDGSLFTGETARGWGSNGPRQEGLERLTWAGQVPFDIKEIKAEPDGFLLTFTEPVDRATAERPESYSIAGFTYLYQEAYGSPPVNRVRCPVRKVEVSPDGMSARLAVICLREGYIHEIKAAGLRTANGAEALLHDTAYYTLIRIPDGPRIIAAEPKEEADLLAAAAVLQSGKTATKKHPTALPNDWPKAEGSKSIVINTQTGMKFDTTLITVKAGEHVRIELRNGDDMLHNFVLCAPGQAETVANAAAALGIEGTAKNFVPDSPDVLYHTALLPPGGTDTLFISAPSVPGDYDYICSFPGHWNLMHGILRVVPR